MRWCKHFGFSVLIGSDTLTHRPLMCGASYAHLLDYPHIRCGSVAGKRTHLFQNGMLEAELLNRATKDKYDRIFRFVQSMRVRQKRHLFYVLRHVPEVSSDTFLPAFGLHCGEFACFQILSEHSRKEGKREQEASSLTRSSSEVSMARSPVGETPRHRTFAENTSASMMPSC